MTYTGQIDQSSYTRRLELAGLKDVAGQLDLGRGLIQTAAPVGSAAVEGDFLAWSWFDEVGNVSRYHADSQGMLDHFVAISHPNDIPGFAKSFGVLAVCTDHGEDPWHSEGCIYDHRSPSKEPISTWMKLSAKMRALLAVLAGIKTGVPATEDILRLAFNDTVAELASRSQNRSAIDQIYFEAFVDDLLQKSGCRPLFRWPLEGGGPTLSFGGGTRATLAIQLATVASGARRLATCSSCSKAYIRPYRAQQRGRRNYCPECKTNGTAEKYRKKIWRTKNGKG